jgi:hypothetical protein
MNLWIGQPCVVDQDGALFLGYDYTKVVMCRPREIYMVEG